MDCIILAGGKGTRLASVTGDTPKCLADINGKAFLEYLLEYLEDQMVTQVTISLGYHYEQVLNWIKSKGFIVKINWVIEQEPLGTGGGVKRALNKTKSDDVIIINGDTLFKIDLNKMMSVDMTGKKALIALKPMKDFDRYGTVSINSDNIISSFNEKKYCADGLINGGIYLLNRREENFDTFPQSFSFEKDFLEKNVGNGQLKGIVFDDYFMDIGVPEGYEQFKLDTKS